MLVSGSINLVWAQGSYCSLVGVLVVGASLDVTRIPLLSSCLGLEYGRGTLPLVAAHLCCRRFEMYWSGPYRLGILGRANWGRVGLGLDSGGLLIWPFTFPELPPVVLGESCDMLGV